MWAQDAAAMYGYAGSSGAASALTPFKQPPQTTVPGGQAGQAAAVAQVTGNSAASGAQATLAQAMAAVPGALQQLAAPAAAVGGPTTLWDFLDSNFVNGVVSAGYVSPAIIQQTVTGSMADVNAVGVSAQPAAAALPPMGAGTGNATWVPLVPSSPGAALSAAALPGGADAVDLSGVSAGTRQAALVGRLSVPQSWTAAAQVANPAGATFAGGGWTNAVGPGAGAAEAASGGVPGMPGMPAAASGGGMGHGPRYGFRVTVMPRPPAAG
jgi:PPE-repeat protein